MRSITFVQAFQYWLKLTALLVPAACFLLLVWGGAAPSRPPAPAPAATGRCRWPTAAAQGLYVTYSLIVATFLGTMGLPHVVVRFYTNPDGRAARRTTLVVLGLLGVVLPAPAGVRRARPRLRARAASQRRADVLVLELPRLMVPGLGGELLTGAGDGRRLRGVPVDVVRPDASRSPACSARTSRHAAGGSAGSRRSGWPPSARWSCRAPGRRWPPGRRRSPAPSGWRSRWRPRRSARCWCSASGGAG